MDIMPANGNNTDDKTCRNEVVVREERMKKLLTIALLAFAFGMPAALLAQDKARFPRISPDKFSPKQQEFAKLLASSPRNDNRNDPPFKGCCRSPDSGFVASR